MFLKAENILVEIARPILFSANSVQMLKITNMETFSDRIYNYFDDR